MHACLTCQKHPAGFYQHISGDPKVLCTPLQAANADAAQSALQLYCSTVRRWLSVLEGYECQVGHAVMQGLGPIQCMNASHVWPSIAWTQPIQGSWAVIMLSESLHCLMPMRSGCA